MSDPLTSTASTVSITVIAVNDAPVLSSIGIQEATEDIDVEISLHASDVDIGTNGQSLVYSATSSDSSMVVPVAVVVNDSVGTLSLTVQPDQNGSVQVTVVVDDSNGGTDSETFTLVISEVNDVPVAHASSFSVLEDSVYTQQLTGVDGDTTTSLVDDQDLTYVLVDSTDHGTLVLNSATGAITYTPDGNYNGIDSLRFVVVDDGTTQ